MSCCGREGLHACCPVDAKQRHDELASERAAGRRSALNEVAFTIRSSSVAGVIVAMGAETLASWIEKGCPVE